MTGRFLEGEVLLYGQLLGSAVPALVMTGRYMGGLQGEVLLQCQLFESAVPAR